MLRAGNTPARRSLWGTGRSFPWSDRGSGGHPYGQAVTPEGGGGGGGQCSYVAPVHVFPWRRTRANNPLTSNLDIVPGRVRQHTAPSPLRDPRPHEVLHQGGLGVLRRTTDRPCNPRRDLPYFRDGDENPAGHMTQQCPDPPPMLLQAPCWDHGPRHGPP